MRLVHRLRQLLRAAAPHAALLVFVLLALAPVALVLGAVQGKDGHGLQRAAEALLSRRDVEGRWLIGQQLANTALVAGTSTLLALLLGVPAGWACARLSFAGRRVMLTACVFAVVAPTILMLAPELLVSAVLRALESLPMVVAAQLSVALPATVLLARAAFDELPRELVEAARLEGAREPQLFVKLGLPLSRRPLFAIAAVVFAAGWGEHLASAALLSRDESQTIASALLSFRGAPSEAVAVFALVASLPAVVLALAGGREVLQLVSIALRPVERDEA